MTNQVGEGKRPKGRPRTRKRVDRCVVCGRKITPARHEIVTCSFRCSRLRRAEISRSLRDHTGEVYRAFVKGLSERDLKLKLAKKGGERPC